MNIPEIYYYDFSGDGYRIDDLKPFLSAERYAYCARMKNETACLRSAYCFMLLRYALKKEFGYTKIPSFERNEYGKPFLADTPDIFFNMSHTEKKVICAVADSPVGADIQDIRQIKNNVGRMFLSEIENSRLTGLSTEAAERELSRIWCVKESYGKMTGKGFAEGFRSFAADELIQRKKAFITERDGCFISLCI